MITLHWFPTHGIVVDGYGRVNHNFHLAEDWIYHTNGWFTLHTVGAYYPHLKRDAP